MLLNHLSYREIQSDGYVIVKRGTIEIKGKGDMTTYLLLGSESSGDMLPLSQYPNLGQVTTETGNFLC